MNMIAYTAEVDYMCDAIKYKYDGRKIFMSARDELMQLFENVGDG